MKVLPDKFKKIWDAWDIRGFILVSLYMQTFLILFSPFRKRTTSKWIMILIWSAYLLADWVAAFSIGLISNSLGDSSEVAEVEDLMVFWAPFLLLHLGGPDTITAFALEDNELWLRHFLGLIIQVAAAAYVFLQSLPNKLWPATMLMFLAGIIKYAERTRALYLASLNSFRGSMLKEPDPGPDYAKLMEEYSSRKEANLPTRIQITPELRKESLVDYYGYNENALSEFEVVQNACHFFDKFKGLLVDLIFSFHERNESREFFRKRTAEDAFAVIEVELNFIYEVLYTKIVAIHCKKGYFFRIISVSSVFLALIFFLLLDKSKFQKPDVGITYTLLIGAIVLDIISFVMLFFSDWTIVARKKPPKESIFATIFEKFLTIRRHGFSNLRYIKFPSRIIIRSGLPEIKCRKISLRILCRRWSESVSQYNMISHCLNERRKKVDEVYDYLGIKEFLDEQAHVSTKEFTGKLRAFIFDELRTKSEVASDSETAKDMCSSRGDWVLRDNNCNDLLPWTIHKEFDESLILWHIATEICYNTEERTNNESEKDKQDREFAKLLSDYMMYLLVMQPTMMLAVAGIGQIRYRDTCAEAKRIFHKWDLIPGGNSKKACERIFSINTEVKPVEVKGDRSKSVLFDGCILAKELKKLKREKWEIMSKVWVELLSFAASHCRANAHAQQVSKGGELISLVWLLMVHLGLGEQFRINEGHARADRKSVV